MRKDLIKKDAKIIIFKFLNKFLMTLQNIKNGNF